MTNRPVFQWSAMLIGIALAFVGLFFAQQKYVWLLWVAGVIFLFLIGLWSRTIWQKLRRSGAMAARAHKEARSKLTTFFASHPVSDATYLDVAYRSPPISDLGAVWGDDVRPRDDFFIAHESVERRQARAAIAKARANTARNEIQLILVDAPTNLDGTISGYRADHVLARTLESFRDPPSRMMQLTGNAVVVCPEGDHMLVMHKGAHEVSSGRHHILGGAFDPMFDGDKIASTARREVREETSHKLEVDITRCPLILHHQHLGNYMMVTYLGASEAYENKTYGSAEGRVRWVPIETLPDLLRDQVWAATGKQAILAWFALGAPVNGARTIRRSRRAKRLLDQYLNRNP
jgi:ADP-ribose pyrophosphatase YjhB (NUDIX family)